MEDTKPAVKSLGVVAGSASVFGTVLLTLHSLGIVAIDPYAGAVVAAASLLSSLLGVLGRVKAKQAIDGIFFSPEA